MNQREIQTTPPKNSITMEKQACKDVFLIKNIQMFHCYVSFLEGTFLDPFWFASNKTPPDPFVFFCNDLSVGEVWNGYISSSMDACGSKVLDQMLGEGRIPSKLKNFTNYRNTVDGPNPAPPGMVKTLWIMG